MTEESDPHPIDRLRGALRHVQDAARLLRDESNHLDSAREHLAAALASAQPETEVEQSEPPSQLPQEDERPLLELASAASYLMEVVSEEARRTQLQIRTAREPEIDRFLDRFRKADLPALIDQVAALHWRADLLETELRRLDSRLREE